VFIKIKNNVLFRNYGTFGYLTDTRNYGYEYAINDNLRIGDKIVSQSGAIFLSVVGRSPRTLSDLVKEISELYPGTNIEILKTDARDFFRVLEQDGFLVSGNTIQECIDKDTGFSYKHLNLRSVGKNNTSSIQRSGKSTQDFFKEYFEVEYVLTNIHVEITSRCNERCVHCYIPHENKNDDIEPAVFYDILGQCKDMKLLHLTLSGGEPMMHKHFCDFLKSCREHDLSVNVLSNLTVLNDSIIDELKKNPLLGVQVSLYSMDHMVHDSITKMKGSFIKTINGILKLIKNDIPLQISCPIMSENKYHYDDVKKWAEGYNLHVGDDFVIIAQYNHATDNIKGRLAVNEVKEVMRHIVTGNNQYLENLARDANEKQMTDPEDIVCSVCNSSICITEKGNVYPCAGWQDYVVGNIKKDSLKEIWETSEKIRYLRGLRKKDFPQCIQCPDKQFCTMCMVRNANEHPQGDPLSVNKYFCSIARVNGEIFMEHKKQLEESPRI